MKLETKKKLSNYLLISQISVYLFITIHAILWHVFGVHILSRLCPFSFGRHVGSLEFNLAVLFWLLIFGSTIILGRYFCAWGCMFGIYQDFIFKLFKRYKVKTIDNKYLLYLSRVLLIGIIIGVLVSGDYEWPTFFGFMAAVTLVGIGLWLIVERKQLAKTPFYLPKYIWLGHYLGGIVYWWITLNVFHKGITFAFAKWGVFETEPWANAITIAILTIFLIYTLGKRAFCKYLCPIGLILRFFSSIPFFKKYKVKAIGECTECNICSKECLMEINPGEEIRTFREIKNPECIHCLNCVSKCPKNVLDFC